MLTNVLTVAVRLLCMVVLLVMLAPTMLLLAITKLKLEANGTTRLPPDIMLPATPIPPATTNAPVPVVILALELLTVKF